MKKLLSLALATALALTALVGCGGGGGGTSGSGGSSGPASSGEPKVLAFPYKGDIATLDMNLCYDGNTAEVICNTVAGLFTHTLDGQLANEMVKDYTVSDDGVVYTFHLRDDFKWSNGNPVTAHDFVYSWRRLADPNTGSTFANYVSNAYMLNGAAVVNGEKDPSELGVKALDDYTLELTLERPVPYLLTFLCEASFRPVNQKFQESLGDKFGTTYQNAIYCGPYYVADWQTEYEIRLEKNPDYPMAGQVKVDTVIIKVVKDGNTALNLFETGQLDAIELSAEQAVQYRDDPRAQPYPSTNMNFLVLNEMNPILANANARKAIACVLDKQFMVDELYSNGSTVADYIIPRGLDFDESGKDFRDTSPIPAAYDLEKGKAYWEQAKQELNLPEYTLRVQTGESPASKTRSEFFQSQMEKNLEGLTIEFDYVTSKTSIENEISGDFDTTFSTWNVDYLDLSFFIDMFTTGFYANTGRYSNPEFDKLAELASTEYINDKEKRWDALREAERILVVEGMGVVPIYQESKLFLVADRVVNYHQSVITPTRAFANMDITQ